jgi:hypothetical protein
MSSEQGKSKEFVEWLENWRTEIHSHATTERALPDKQIKGEAGGKKAVVLNRGTSLLQSNDADEATRIEG